jgi:4-hydroxybenzoate polyprenyltransferase/beta-phosphoglucomutase-like phosphatase (HAD superfamily)
MPDPKTEVPLIVDLDGTLTRTDTLLEGLWWVARKNPQALPRLVKSFFEGGKTAVKEACWAACQSDPQYAQKHLGTLPWHESVIGFITEEKSRGRKIYMATGSHRATAEKATEAAGLLHLFDGILATESGGKNLRGPTKARALCETFGEGAFDYIGNEPGDLPVWVAARKALVVESTQHPRLGRKVEGHRRVDTLFPKKRKRRDVWNKGLRLHQWLKNLLVFAPMLAAHQYADPQKWALGLGAFLAFGFCASGAYLLNDLLDLEHDRVHDHKKKRPLAAGEISIPSALTLAVLLPTSGLAAAFMLGFGPTMAVYLASTVAYSLWLKKLPIVDITILAGLYCIRIFAGGQATGDDVSFWMTAFAAFLFLSLACVKRHAELKNLLTKPSESRAKGRGYTTADLTLTGTLGMAAGTVAPLVLALYLKDKAAAEFYPNPEWLWATCALVFIWLGGIWRDTEAGHMDKEDPVAYSLENKQSLIILGLLGLSLVLASLPK